MEPLACCNRAVKRAGVRKGTSSLVVGLGSIGLLMGQSVKAFNGDVIGCDLIEERVALASNLNFDASVKFEDNDTTSEKIKEMTCGLGADIVFMTSGSDKALDFALKPDSAMQVSLCVKLLADRPVETGTLFYFDLLNQEFETIPMI